MERTPTLENTRAMTLRTLRRKEDQAWEMAGLARRDNDMADAQHQTDMARAYRKIICERVRAGEEL